MSKQAQIQEALTNEDPYIHLLASMPDERLERKLRIVHSQMDIALKNKQEEALELLAIWEKQIIEARLLKDEKEFEPYEDAFWQEPPATEIFRESAAEMTVENHAETIEENTIELPAKTGHKAAPQLTLF